MPYFVSHLSNSTNIIFHCFVPVPDFFKTKYTASLILFILANSLFCLYVCNYCLTHTIPHKQYTVCMLRCIPQYQMSASYPLFVCWDIQRYVCESEQTPYIVGRVRINGNIPPATIWFHGAVYIVHSDWTASSYCGSLVKMKIFINFY